MLAVILGLIFVATFLFVAYGMPFLFGITMQFNTQRAKKFMREMERSLIQEDIKKVSAFYVIGPFILGGFGFFMGTMMGLEGMMLLFTIAGGILLGFISPKFYINSLLARRKRMFDDQLIDALMIMSSSFRGGLSLIQAMEAVVEEMPDPIRQEFSIVLGENKMGVSMDDSMNRLHDRMPSPSLQQMISAILLARETGGNLPVIFTRIVASIRERKKIQESLMVLTLQGKIQAIVMSGLPVGFFFIVTGSNPEYFNSLTTTPVGQKLAIVAIVLWLIGNFFIWKISAFNDF